MKHIRYLFLILILVCMPFFHSCNHNNDNNYETGQITATGTDVIFNTNAVQNLFFLMKTDSILCKEVIAFNSFIEYVYQTEEFKIWVEHIDNFYEGENEKQTMELIQDAKKAFANRRDQ